MPTPPPLLLAAGLWLTPAGEAGPGGVDEAGLGPVVEDARLRVHTDRVEAGAVRQGLELRVGEDWRRWTVDVDEGALPGQVQVRLRDETGHVHTRGLVLEGVTVDERSRELAASLALLVEQLEQQRAEPVPPPEPAAAPALRAPRVEGFVGVGPRLALDARRPSTLDLGLSLVGGAWLVRDHLQPVAELAWARSELGELRVDALRVGAGVLGGAAGPRGRLWGGGGALVRAQWAQATAAGRARGWWASPAVVGAIQYRGRIVVIGGWIGADLVLPSLLARGDAHTLRWSSVRPMATLHLGLRLPPRREPRGRARARSSP